MPDKVSVIIPSYNSASCIMRAIESVLNQTYENLEVIIADDASADDTRSIVSQIKDPRVKLIARQQNGGAAAARNTATQAASGRYIAFLDSDDYWTPHKLSVQVEKMQEEDSGFSCTDYINKAKNRGLLVKMPQEINYRSLLRGNVINTSTVVYDSGKLGKNYMPALAKAEDYATWLSLLKRCGTALIIRQPLAYRIRRSNSLSSGWVAMKYFTCKVYRETQGLSLILSLYYVLRPLPMGLWRRIRRACIQRTLD